MIISTDRDVYIAGERVYFTVKFDENTANTSDYSYITLESNSGNKIFTGCMKINSSMAYSSIYLPDTLSSGIYHLVSFTNYMRNYGSSSYARKNILIVNRFDTELSFSASAHNLKIGDSLTRKVSAESRSSAPVITSDKRNYGQREKVIVNLQIPGNYKDNPVSVTVRQAAPFTFAFSGTIHANLLKENNCKYLPEKSGIILQGILKSDNNNPVPRAPVFLSCEDSIANLQYGTTNSEGIFRFFLNPFYFGKSLAIKSDKDFKGHIEIDNKFIPDNIEPPPGIEISGDLVKYIENSQKYQTINYTYKRDLLMETKNPGIESGYRPSVYWNPEEVVYPSDYTYLPDFMEISREIIPFLKTRAHNNDYVASILDFDQDVFTDVFIFVDGVLIENVGQIIPLDSKKIKKIEVVTNTRSIGEFNIPSVLSLQTANHEAKNFRWKLPVQKLQADSIMQLAQYTPGGLETFPHSLPDFRQLLYWNPSLDCGKNNSVNFETFTSDCTGEFEIVLTCTEKNGTRMEYKKTFNVKHQ